VCYPVSCKTCGKTSWAGCGQHVADVKRSVPAAQWCGGHADAPSAAPQGFLARIFGR